MDSPPPGDLRDILRAYSKYAGDAGDAGDIRDTWDNIHGR